MTHYPDDKKEAIENRLKEIFEDEWEELEEVRFRDVTDDDYKSTLTFATVYAHDNRIGIPDNLPLHSVKKNEGNLWRLHVKDLELDY